MKLRNLSIATAMLALSSLFMASTCNHSPSPQTVAYVTLSQASNILDAKLAIFDIKVQERKAAGNPIPAAKEIEVRQAYVDATKAIQAAARVAAGGLSATTPDEVRRLVDSFLALLVQFVPPEN